MLHRVVVVGRRGALAVTGSDARPRAAWRGVAVPTEHGGWGLTAEPVLLGLIVAPSWAGLLLGVAALVAFVARTPLRVVLVDQRRRRRHPRPALARRILAVELSVLAALVVGAVLAADAPFWWPVLVAAPLVAVELWFDMRSRSRRLVPELAGAVGIGAVAAMIVLAAAHDTRLAIGVWAVLAARSITAIPYVRAQIARVHGRSDGERSLLATDLAAVAVAALGVVAESALAPGAAAVAVAIGVQRIERRGPVPVPKVLGLRQMGLGALVVLASAVGVIALG